MATRRPLDVPAELVEAFERSGAVSEYLIGLVPEQGLTSRATFGPAAGGSDRRQSEPRQPLAA
jgi:hypothetical protein